MIPAIPPLTVRPIVHTGHLDEWLTILRALGARTLSADPTWAEVELDRGRVALHGLFEGVREGEVALGFETPDLEAYAAAVLPMEGMTVERVAADHGDAIRVAGRDGLEFMIDARPASELPATVTTSARQLWITTKVADTAQDLESLGLRKRHTNVNGRTISMSAAEGEVLVHVADTGTIGATVSVDTTDLDAAHKALIDAGIGHDVIDETHGRTLRVPFPGRPDEDLWIAQEDDDPVGVIKHL